VTRYLGRGKCGQPGRGDNKGLSGEKELRAKISARKSGGKKIGRREGE